MPPRKIHCRECDCRFDLEPEDAGLRKVRCPQCGAMVPVRPVTARQDYGTTRRSSGPRWLVILVVLGGVLGLGCCGGVIGLIWWSLQPYNFPEQTHDYAEARKTFKTTLTSKTPAPQVAQGGQPPPGVTEVTYKSGELQLKAWVNRPPAGAPPAAAVLYLHGGFAFDPEDWDQCKPFRDAGFVTMTPSLRGENGQAGWFSMFYDEVDDVLAAAQFLAKMPGVDSKRVFIAGHSAGGTLALLAAMTSKEFKACASFSGSPDQVKFAEQEQGLVRFDTSDMKELEMRSPLAFPKSFKCPVRLYWGDGEIFFRFSSRKLAKKASAAGLDVQAIELPGDHLTSVDPAMRQAITFFQQQK